MAPRTTGRHLGLSASDERMTKSARGPPPAPIICETTFLGRLLEGRGGFDG